MYQKAPLAGLPQKQLMPSGSNAFLDRILADNVSNSFGVLATLLDMIPVASVFFSFTNAGKFLH